MNLPKHLSGPLQKLLANPHVSRVLGHHIDIHGLPSFSFWRMNLIFWVAFGMINFAIRWSLQIPWHQAIVLTILNEGLAFFFALTLRAIYRQSEVAFRLSTAIRVVVGSMFGALFLSLMAFAITRYTGWRTPNLTLFESAELHFILLWTALLGWSLGYFWVKAERAWALEFRHAEVAEHDAYRMELQMLRAQLDPHFLFNSLNSIASEIQPRPDAAIEMVCQLSEYLRYSLEHRKQTFSPLSAELGAMRAYLEIERTRFGERLEFSIDTSPAALASIVPSFLLQPLVENALKHNLLERKQKMSLVIHASRAEGQLYIEVVNTGTLTHEGPSKSGGLGLETLRRRLDLHYPQRHSFLLEQRGPLVYATLELWGIPCSA